MSKKLTYKYVKDYFEEQGCYLLEDKYQNCDTPMNYTCQCGNQSKIKFSHFKNGVRCKKCGGNEKYLLDDIKQYFKDNGCELLEKKYKNCLIKMKYKCSCGNLSKICFSNFREGQRCYKCKAKRAAIKTKYQFEYVKQYFKDHGCELLEKKYKNCLTKLTYICECKEINTITFSEFRQGVRCHKCGIIKRTGENSSTWNPNLTDNDRQDRRNSNEYRQWIKDIYRKNNYTCQKCLKRGGLVLHAHHIEGFAENKKLRTDINNGITFCKKCHHLFHSIYGKKNINRKHLNVFLKTA